MSFLCVWLLSHTVLVKSIHTVYIMVHAFSLLCTMLWWPLVVKNWLLMQETRRGFGPWEGPLEEAWQPIQYSCLENPMDQRAWGGFTVIESQELVAHDWSDFAQYCIHTNTHRHAALFITVWIHHFILCYFLSCWWALGQLCFGAIPNRCHYEHLRTYLLLWMVVFFVVWFKWAADCLQPYGL